MRSFFDAYLLKHVWQVLNALAASDSPEVHPPASSKPDLTRSDLLLVLDQLDFGITDKEARWALHDLLLRIGRAIGADGTARVYLRLRDQRVLEDVLLGSKVRRVWKRGNAEGKNATFTLTQEFAATLLERAPAARATREARLNAAAAKPAGRASKKKNAG